MKIRNKTKRIVRHFLIKDKRLVRHILEAETAKVYLRTRSLAQDSKMQRDPCNQIELILQQFLLILINRTNVNT